MPMMIDVMCYCCCLQVWLTLADAYVASQKIDWEQTIKFTFNEKSNPDDNNLGMQIVKVGFLLSFIKTNIRYYILVLFLAFLSVLVTLLYWIPFNLFKPGDF